MELPVTGRYPWLDAYLLKNPGAERDYKEEWGWHRYRVRGKQFAALCRPEEKYGLYGGKLLLNLKCDPCMAELFRQEYPRQILPGFYMDKRTWIAVLLEKALPENVLRALCDTSYRLVLEKLPKKVQRELSQQPEEAAASTF